MTSVRAGAPWMKRRARREAPHTRGEGGGPEGVTLGEGKLTDQGPGLST